MKVSNLFSHTSREAPAEAEISSHRLLIRAGYIRQLAAGIFTYLPLAQRTLMKIENIMREEINKIGGQEIFMPIVHPADIWMETGRWFRIGSEMGRFQDKNSRDMVLSMTHEEVIADLARREIQSYRQLPQLLYQIQTKWRDDPRPRAGLIRAREFTMLDSYSLDKDEEGLDRQYRDHYHAYFNIFKRCGLEVLAVRSDVGMMGGKLAHEFIYLTSMGEDTIMVCNRCGYQANQQIAVFSKIPFSDELHKSKINVATPGIKTIDDLSEFLGIPKEKTAKALFMIATRLENSEQVDEFIFIVIRGDMSLNQTKLANALQADELRPATEDEIREVGAVPGYASPLGLDNVFVAVDDLIPISPNLVAGANLDGYHTLNVNYHRDIKANLIGDFVLAEDGHSCHRCDGVLHAVRGVEVGNIFKLGTHYSEMMNCFYTSDDGSIKPIYMGSYGIGTGRLFACIAEEYHDENGLCLPITIAPYQVHLITLRSKSGKPDTRDGMGTEHNPWICSENLYRELRAANIEVLFDDRDESPGVKFADADLIGIPIRITISNRSLNQGGMEIKLRNEQDKKIIRLGEAVSYIRNTIIKLLSDHDVGIHIEPFAT